MELARLLNSFDGNCSLNLGFVRTSFHRSSSRLIFERLLVQGIGCKSLLGAAAAPTLITSQSHAMLPQLRVQENGVYANQSFLRRKAFRSGLPKYCLDPRAIGKKSSKEWKGDKKAYFAIPWIRLVIEDILQEPIWQVKECSRWPVMH